MYNFENSDARMGQLIAHWSPNQGTWHSTLTQHASIKLFSGMSVQNNSWRLKLLPRYF